MTPEKTTFPPTEPATETHAAETSMGQLQRVPGEVVRPPSNLFFPLTAVFGVAFVVTIFSLVARMFGNPRAPINRFLDEYGMHLILTEVIGLLLSGLLAMVVDRMQTLSRPADQGDA